MTLLSSLEIVKPRRNGRNKTMQHIATLLGHVRCAGAGQMNASLLSTTCLYGTNVAKRVEQTSCNLKCRENHLTIFKLDLTSSKMLRHQCCNRIIFIFFHPGEKWVPANLGGNFLRWSNSPSSGGSGNTPCPFICY